MVVDKLENIEKYASLNPLFAQAIDFLKSHDLDTLEIGKTELKGKDLLVNVAQTKPKTKEDAKLETHKDFIDIQIPLSGTVPVFCGLLFPVRLFALLTWSWLPFLQSGWFLYLQSL